MWVSVCVCIYVRARMSLCLCVYPSKLKLCVCVNLSIKRAGWSGDVTQLQGRQSSRENTSNRSNRTLACISRARRARSPQRVARAQTQSHSRLRFAPSTRTISAEGCAHTGQIALSPAFRALDAHDLRRGLRAHRPSRALACISRPRHARSPQRVARTPDKSHSRLHFAHSTCTISAEGCAHTGQIALSPAFRALDTHDLRRGLHFRLTLFVPPSAFKREFIKWGSVFIRTSPAQLFHTHTCILILHLDVGCFHSSTYTGVRIEV